MVETVNETKAEKKPDPKVVKPEVEQDVDENESTTDAQSTSTTLSEQANRPGDAEALRLARERAATAPSELPGITISEQKPAAPALDKATLEKYAKELHDALHSKSLLVFSNPDEEKLWRLLEPLNQADRKALEQIYKEKHGGDLRDQLKDKLDEKDFRRAEAIMNRKDGQANDAGALMVALTTMKDDSARGNQELRAVLKSLTAADLEKLDKDFRAAYGKGYLESIQSAKGLTAENREALGFLTKGSDKRTPEDIKAAAEIALRHKNKEMFTQVLGGDSTAAQDARKQLQSNSEFVSRFNAQWSKDQVMKDVLKDGRVSLATIAIDNTDNIWFLNNKDNVKLAAKHASDKERQDFATGRDLALSGKAPQNDEQKAALDFYKRIHGAFQKSGNERDVALWEDQLMRKGSLVSDIIDSYDSGWGVGSLRVGDGAKRQELFSKIEKISQDDWKRLTDPTTGPQFRKDLEAALSTFADQGEKERALKLIDEKAKAKTYEESQQVKRTLFETVDDNKGSVFLGMGTSYDGKNVMDALMNMSPQEAEKYRTDATQRKKIDDFVKENLNHNEKELAQRILKRIAENRQPSDVEKAADQIFLNSIRGEKPDKQLRDIEALMKDKATRDRLNKPDGELSPEDRKLKTLIENQIASAALKAGHYSHDPYGSPYHYTAIVERFSKPLFQDGRLPLDLKVDLKYPKQELIKELANPSITGAEREKAMKSLNADEAKIVSAGLAQNGQLRLEDKLRGFVLGDGSKYEDFKAELEKLSHADKQKLKDEYTRKYGGTLNDDFLKKVDEKDSIEYKNLITPAEVHGREMFYDLQRRMFDNAGGVTADGAEMTMQRASQMYEENLEKYGGNLPPEVKKQLSEYFSESIKQYQDSKEKLAEVVIDATITAVAIAATIASGGVLGPAAIAAIAAGSAAFRVGMMKAMRGGSYQLTPGNMAKDAALGALTGALAALGPETFALIGKTGAQAATATGIILKKPITEAIEQAVTTAMKQGGEQLVKEGTEQVVRQGAEQVVKQGTEQVIKEGTEQVVKEGAERIVTQTVADNVTSAGAQSLSNIVKEGADQQLAGELGKILTNAAVNGEKVSAQQVDNIARKLLRDDIQKALTSSNPAVREAAEKQLAQLSGAIKEQLGSTVTDKAVLSSREWAADFLKNTVGRSAVNNAKVGAIANVATEPAYSFLNGQGFDYDRLVQGGVVGFVAGGVAPIAFKGAFRAAEVSGVTRVIGSGVEKAGHVYTASKDVIAKIGRTADNRAVINVADNPHITGFEVIGPDGSRRVHSFDDPDIVKNGMAEVPEGARPMMRTDTSGHLVDKNGLRLNEDGTHQLAIINDKQYRVNSEGKLVNDQGVALTEAELAAHGLPANFHAEEKLTGRVTLESQIVGASSEGTPLLAGDKVIHKGQVHNLVGFDTQTGEAILDIPDKRKFAGEFRKIPLTELERNYKPVEINGITYYKDSKNAVYFGTREPGGSFTIGREYRYSLAPQSEIAAVPKVQRPIVEPKTEGAKTLEVMRIPTVERSAITDIRPVDMYTGSKVMVNGKELTVNGKPVELTGEPLKIGRQDLGLIGVQSGEIVSSKHGEIIWDAKQQMYLLRDHSKNGTYVKRAGSNDFIKVHGTTEKPEGIYLGPGDEIRLGAKNGPELKINMPNAERHLELASKGPKGDTQIFFDGRPVTRQGDEVIIGRQYQIVGDGTRDVLNRRVASEHAKLKWDDKTNSWTITDLTPVQKPQQNPFGTVIMRTGGNGTYITHKDGTTEFLQGTSKRLQYGDKITLGSIDGPELKLSTNVNGKPLPDGRVEYSRPNGDRVLVRPDGTKEFISASGLSHIEDSMGKVIKATDSNGIDRIYQYNSKGDLVGLNIQGTRVFTTDLTNWHVVQADGKSQSWYRGKVGVESDGSLRFETADVPPKVTIQRLDGALEVVHANGRVDYEGLTFAKESATLRDLSSSFETPQRAERFRTIMSGFENTAKARGISEQEIAKTYHQVNRLLRGNESTMLSNRERQALAEQILYQGQTPHWIDQGSNNTCNVTTVEKRLFTRNPSEAARLITDVALTGRYVTASGTVVDLSRVPNAIRPDVEAQALLQRGFDRDNWSDIKVDGGRTWASQIFENTAVNIHWAKSNAFGRQPGEAIVYEKIAGYKGDDTGERLVKYKVAPNGHLVREELQADGKFIRAPYVDTDNLAKITKEISGREEGQFIIRRATTSAPDQPGSSTYRIRSSKDLESALTKMEKEGNFPAIIQVHTADPLFKSTSGNPNGGGDGGWHVVNVERIRRDESGQMWVEFTNQWGTKKDHLGKDAVKVEDLYRATNNPNPGKANGLDDGNALANSGEKNIISADKRSKLDKILRRAENHTDFIKLAEEKSLSIADIGRYLKTLDDVSTVSDSQLKTLALLQMRVNNDTIDLNDPIVRSILQRAQTSSEFGDIIRGFGVRAQRLLDKDKTSDVPLDFLRQLNADNMKALPPLTFSTLVNRGVKDPRLALFTPQQRASFMADLLKAADENGLEAVRTKSTIQIYDRGLSEKPAFEYFDSARNLITAKLTPNDLANMDGKQISAVRDALKRKVTDAEPAGQKNWTYDGVKVMADALHGEKVRPDHISSLLDDLSGPDRQIALQVIGERSNFLTQEGLNREFRTLGQEIQARGFFNQLKGGESRNRLRNNVTVAVLGDATVGSELAYQFRKATGMSLDFKVIKSPADLEKAIGNPPNSKLVLFDSINSAGDTEMVKALQKARDEGNMMIPDLPAEFAGGLNINDISGIPNGGPHLAAAKEKLHAMVELKRIDLDQTQEFQLSSTKIAATQSEIDEFTVQMRKSLTDGDPPFRDQAEARALLFFAHNSEFAPEAARVFAQGTHRVTHTEMMENAYWLNEKILERQGKKLDDVIFVTDIDSQGSNRMINSLYRRANGLEGPEYDRNFMSLDAVKTLASQKGADGKSMLDGKRIVYLDDGIYSGSQVVQTVLPKLKNVAKLSEAEPQITIATLHGYPDGVEHVLRSNGDLNPPVEIIIGRDPLFKSQFSQQALDMLKDNSIARSLGGTRGLKYYLDKAKYDRSTESSLSTGIVLPYKVPNNNSTKLNDLYENYLGFAGAHSESRGVDLVDLPAPKQFAEDMRQNFKVLEEEIKTAEDIADVLGDGVEGWLRKDKVMASELNLKGKRVHVRFDDTPQTTYDKGNGVFVTLDSRNGTMDNVEFAQNELFRKLRERVAQKDDRLYPMNTLRDIPGIDKYTVVNDDFLAGPAPRENTIKELKKKGVKTIFDFRKEPNADEAKWCQENGLEYRHMPLSANNMTNEQMDDILRAINEQTQAGQKIYIHCQFGRDRTSAVVSSWRLAHQVPYAEAHADLARHFSYNPRTSGAERVVDFLAQRVDHIVDGVNF